MLFFCSCGKHKAIELSLFRVIRNLRDGLTYFELEINSDWFKGDHKPAFRAALTVFNLQVFEFDYYDTRHTDDDGNYLD